MFSLYLKYDNKNKFISENQNIEWKESWRDEYLKWICGFANANGGKLIIGVNDEGTRDLEILVEIGVFEKIGEKKGRKYKLIRT